jgi:hypothetical protein
MVMSRLDYIGSKVLGTAILLAMLLAAFAAFAQEEVEDIGPAVDTSAIEEPEVEAVLPEDIGPAVDTSAPGNGITRSTAGNRVMDSIELGRTEITGNQELPTVMYIVPWKKADPGDLMGKPVNTLLDEVLAPIDREEFVRQVDYYQDLYGENEQE